MSMFMSPKSEATVLLWGDRWWLPHHRLPVPFADLTQAADQLAAAWPEPNRTLRLIFQPDDFATVPAECPHGNRATLAAVLSEEHPALRHPAHVWSYEPILAIGDGFTTLLHYETKPLLFSLVQRLTECGFTITTVWPMAAWLNALPPELSDSGAMTICAVQGDRFCLYRHSADGVRAVRTGHGGDAVTAVATHLGALTTQPETEFVLYVTTEEQLIERLGEKVPLDTRHVVGVFTIWQALARPTPLSARHPAQLLPPVPFVSPPQVIRLITAACLVAAAIIAAEPVRDLAKARSALTSAGKEKTALRSEIATLRTNEAEALRLQSRLDALTGDPLPWADWLRALPRNLPASVVLVSLEANRTGFRIAGGIAGEVSDENWQRWMAGIRDPNRWNWREIPAAKPTDALSLRGSWQ